MGQRLCSGGVSWVRKVTGDGMDGVEDLRLVDHHAHGVVKADLDRAGFEGLISESFHPPPPDTSHFDSPIGLAIRRWCGPVLGLEPFAPPDEYIARRLDLGAEDVARRFLREAGLGALLIDTGYRSDELHDPGGMRGLAGVQVHEIVRLEAVAEAVAETGVDASAYPSAYTDALEEASRDAVGLKSVVAYRGGFAFDPDPPEHAEVIRAAGAFLDTAGSGQPRLTDAVLLRFGIWTGARLARDRGLPVQFHVGWGDPDLELHLTNPTLITRLIREFARLEVNVALLHCYPFHREAGYLAAMYPNVYFDVGSALHYLGPSSGRLLAEAVEVAPFSKLLFSSDAFAVAEQYHLGAMLFRRALRAILDGWIAADHCDAATAERIAEAIGRGNALRIYSLPEFPDPR
jgi:predicted TIM-barrel fold metal-dependent hydrolase